MPRSGIQLCVPFEERRLARWDPPFLVQPKLDGERCRAIFSGPDNVGYRLLSSEQNEFRSVPHINEALNKLWRSTGLTAELDGELYCHGMPFNELHARVGRTVNFHPDFQSVEFHVFDLVDERPQFERTAELCTKHFDLPLRLVRSEIANSLDDILEIYNSFIAQNYEGIIVRHIEALYERKRSTWIMKFKPKRSDWYMVCGYSVEIDKNKELKPGNLGRIICAGNENSNPLMIGEYPPGIKVPNGYFSVGSGLTRDQRQRYWRERETLPGLLCHVQYQHTLKNVPRFPVFMELVKQKEILSRMVG
jgi:ATP-dependent DNA ligase